MRRLYSAALSFAVIAGAFAPVVSHAATAAVALTPYTAPDKSASAGVPAGWTVTKGDHGVIQMKGPQGEAISMGNGIFVRNGAFQAGAPATPPVSATMPYQASLSEKYMMLWQQAAASQGQPVPQITIISATPIPIAPTIAQCGLFLGTMTSPSGPSKFETQFCSMTLDPGGVYKLIWKNASVPAALAPQERATAEAVLHSYRMSMASLKLLLQPLTPKMPAMAPRMPSVGGNVGGGSVIGGEISADHMANCMDLGVLREVPERQLPSYCK